MVFTNKPAITGHIRYYDHKNKKIRLKNQVPTEYLPKGMDNPPKPEGWVPPQRGPKKRKADQGPGTPLSSANNGTESGTMTPNSISSMSLSYMGGQDLINVPLRDNR